MDSFVRKIIFRSSPNIGMLFKICTKWNLVLTPNAYSSYTTIKLKQVYKLNINNITKPIIYEEITLTKWLWEYALLGHSVFRVQSVCPF